MSMEKIKAYEGVSKSTMTPREAEAMAFTKSALLMEEAASISDNKTALSQALRFNHLLWTIVQADITEEANTLPPEIKANLLSLSIFVDKQTIKALKSGDPQDVQTLIAINRNIASGLRTEPQAA